MKVSMDDIISNIQEWEINIWENDEKDILMIDRHHGEIIYGRYDCNFNEKVGCMTHL